MHSTQTKKRKDLSQFDNSRYHKDSQGMTKAKSVRYLEEETFVALLRTADHLERRAAAMLKPNGLSPTQYNALRILRGAGGDGLTCGEIGERMLNHDPDITRLLTRLERRGLIRRSRGQKDRRVITTRITSAGLNLLHSLDRPVEKFQRQLLCHVGKRGLQSLIRLLKLAQGK